MKCPNCQTVDMSEKKFKNVKFDMCETCHGFWFDHNELNNVINIAVKGLFIPKSASSCNKHCPRCAENMYNFKYPQTYCYIDMCKKCKGLWFDSRELEEIKIVRESLEKKGQLEKVLQPEGPKGALLEFVNSAINSLTKFEQW